MPILFTGPHSYSASPAELAFAHLKSVDCNPERKPMGKKTFINVIEGVVARFRQLSKAQLMMYWHHCLQHVLRYLDLQRI